MGCLLTLLTGGLFIIVWVLADLAGIISPFRCQGCGKARTGFAGTLLSFLFIIVEGVPLVVEGW